jgi:hypothetical protein
MFDSTKKRLSAVGILASMLVAAGTAVFLFNNSTAHAFNSKPSAFVKEFNCTVEYYAHFDDIDLQFKKRSCAPSGDGKTRGACISVAMV